MVLGVALLVRLASLYCDSLLPLFRHLRLDSQIYADAGKAIAGGDWLLGHDVLHWSPAYCYFVGAVYTGLGAGPWALRGVQLVLGLGVVLWTMEACRLLWGDRWARVGGLAAALYGPFVFYGTELLADGLATALNALLLLQLVQLATAAAPRTRQWVALGVTWGLAVATRPNALVLLAPIAVAAFSRGDARARAARHLGTAALAGALTLLPVTLRNVLVAGERVLVTDSGGLNFFIGNGAGATGTFRVPQGIPDGANPQVEFQAFKRMAEQQEGHPLTSRASDAHWFAATWRHLGAHPLEGLKVMWRKLWLFWSAREIPNTEDYSFMRTLQPVLALPLLQFGAVAPLALLGTVLLLWRRERGASAVAAMNLALCAANVAIFVLAHYRISAVPGLLVAAVGAVQWAFAAERTPRERAVFAASLVPVLALVWTPQVPQSYDGQYFKLGFAYHSLGDLENAEDAYLKALEINPAHLSSHKNLGMLYEQAASPARAVAQWQAVVRLGEQARRPEYVSDAQAHLARLQAAPPEGPLAP
jgi:4-amino-4-deoxy-L-arabinose transferase-like glycosyltransferase